MGLATGGLSIRHYGSVAALQDGGEDGGGGLLVDLLLGAVDVEHAVVLEVQPFLVGAAQGEACAGELAVDGDVVGG